MPIESLQNYLGASLPLRLDAGQYVRLPGRVFAIVFLSAIIVHVLGPSGPGPLDLVMHSAVVGLVYVIAVGIASMTLAALGSTAKVLRVWHIWVVSLAGFIVGYYLLPVDGLVDRLPGPDALRQLDSMGFAQLLPVWLLATYLFVQPYLARSLALEVARLRDFNTRLQQRNVAAGMDDPTPIRFATGRTDFSLPAGAIRNISVDDHYCYVHFRRGEGYGKRDIAMPLRDVQALLPHGFIRVHRAHVVNVAFLSAVRRTGRNIRVVLEGGYEVPVSRHRLADVLPLLEHHARP